MEEESEMVSEQCYLLEQLELLIMETNNQELRSGNNNLQVHVSTEQVS